MNFLKRLSFGGGLSLSQITGTDSESTPTPNAESHQSTQPPVLVQPRRNLPKSTAVLSFWIWENIHKGGLEDNASIKSTEKVLSRQFRDGKNTFKLIDTPGFDNIAMSNLEAFARLADYLLHETRVEFGISGIVYLHRAGDPLDSRALKQNMDVISDVFLGDPGLARLTIVVVPESGMDRAACVRVASRATVFRALHAKGARIVGARLNQKSIDQILTPYAFQDPLLLHIQQEAIRDPHIVPGTLIEERLGYYQPESMKLLVDQQVKQCLVPHTDLLRSLETTLKEKELELQESSRARGQAKQQVASTQEEILALRQKLQRSQGDNESLLSQLQLHKGYAEEIYSLQAVLKDAESKLLSYSQAYQQTKQQLTTSREESSGLRQQLQQIQSEYASLRSQLQIQENTEQSDIVQTLKDLNRDIDDFSRSISEHLSDNYVHEVFGKEPSDMTALNARHLPELKALLNHTDGRPSLVAASDEMGMPIEDFLDYATRALLCGYLCQNVFGPFHPAIDPSHNKIMATMYDDVQRREPQAVAGKWRATCFKSIYKPETLDATAQHVPSLVQEFADACLNPLMTYFFGQKPELRLEDRHLDRLSRLFKTAWDWNSTLKGHVIVLGDFYPTQYAPGHRFDPALMSEFEPGPRKSQSKYILGTLGLGLLASRAVGGGQPPETTVVVKATVAMVGLYA
ncbi:hypothetical protein FRC07_003748 [Ceratobasidium sp. 392]|nr:hypothetical protein FRC07_003748 [Ceratobasidium sp. 392]